MSYLEKIFNYRQARGRRVIENIFGIFANVWRIFRTEINAEPEKIDRIVMAAVCLHNFRIIEKENVTEFLEPSGLPNQNKSMRQLNSGGVKLFGDSRGHCEEVRRELAEYFVNGGRVYWQDNLIH